MKTLALILLLGCTQLSYGQSCNPDSLIILPVRASDTDPNIPWELYRHYTFYNPECVEKNKLLVHLVGTFDNPTSTQYFPSLAANNGIHVLSLKYHNDTSGQTACNNSSDVDCHYNFRREIIEGVDYSPEIHVDTDNSIYNRLIKLVQYMDNNFPSQNWDQFYTNDSIHWDMVMVSGHSQGGGHAGVIAIEKPVDRVLMFASPNDYSSFYTQLAPWTNMPHAAADSAYYSFNNIHDGVGPYDWQYTAAVNLGEDNFGDSVNVDVNDCPYNGSHNLYSAMDEGPIGSHGMMVHDNSVPLDGNNEPIFIQEWSYMLGLGCSTANIEEVKAVEFSVYPNPVNDFLTISIDQNLEGVAFVIYNPLGQIVLDGKFNNSSNQINTSELEQGNYVLVIHQEQQDISIQFLK